MSRPYAFVFTLVSLLLPALVVGQPGSEQPGYFPIEDLGILPAESLNLEINLTGPMMKLVALATDDEEPELARLVEDLDSIRVRGSDLEGVGVEEVRSGLRAASQRLADAGWQTMVRMRDEDDEVYIYFKEQNGEMVGLTVLSLESNEAMLINLVGRIDPVGLSDLARGLDLPQLERAATEETP